MTRLLLPEDERWNLTHRKGLTTKKPMTSQTRSLNVRTKYDAATKLYETVCQTIIRIAKMHNPSDYPTQIFLIISESQKFVQPCS
jgi:hypothetical protein